MIADLLLRLLGENPNSVEFYDSADKWTEIIYQGIELSRSLLPLLLPVIPILWLLWRKRRNKKITRKNIILVIIISLALILLGFYLPDFIVELVAGIGVNQLYSN